MSNEVEVNKKFGEETKVTLSIKTIAWIIGLLLSAVTTLATMGYLDMKSDIKNQQDIFEQEKQKYKDEIKNLLQSELKDEREKRDIMYKDIYDIKGDIKVILDRTSNNHSNTNTPITTPEAIPLPTTPTTRTSTGR